ncbi:hypothetical protein KIN20_002078 [Parelaphostrongylus tenuis]|uniref:Uncharacterized protein n=1 Tax=Parelaphostrongylus tenuis TaxID=148309 RepID=A0AAD5LUP1_PARTN|nr:hypothetical protein KIN20_002078 [Parelaphostrongylus tenuis]
MDEAKCRMDATRTHPSPRTTTYTMGGRIHSKNQSAAFISIFTSPVIVPTDIPQITVYNTRQWPCSSETTTMGDIREKTRRNGRCAKVHTIREDGPPKYPSK